MGYALPTWRPFSTETESPPAHEAVTVLAAQDPPGLVVVDGRGRPVTVLPSYCQEDPALARVVGEGSRPRVLATPWCLPLRPRPPAGPFEHHFDTA